MHKKLFISAKGEAAAAADREFISRDLFGLFDVNSFPETFWGFLMCVCSASLLSDFHFPKCCATPAREREKMGHSNVVPLCQGSWAEKVMWSAAFG